MPAAEVDECVGGDVRLVIKGTNMGVYMMGLEIERERGRDVTVLVEAPS